MAFSGVDALNLQGISLPCPALPTVPDPRADLADPSAARHGIRMNSVSSDDQLPTLKRDLRCRVLWCHPDSRFTSELTLTARI